MARQKYKDIKDLRHFICNLSVVPIFERPEHGSQMVSQLLFGECGSVVVVKNKHWYKVSSDDVGVTGWVDTNQIFLISETQYHLYNNKKAYLIDICSVVLNDQTPIPILMGSSLRQYDGISFRMPDGKYICNGLVAIPEELTLTEDVILKLARKYLKAPYLKGGRTIFGIDAGALVQIILKNFNIHLPVMPEQQLNYGEIVDFIEQSQPGDIAFFHDDTGNINHCGIILSKFKIIHADGFVRIDKLDHFGIYSKEKKKYTHRLRLIKRVTKLAESKKASSEFTDNAF